jgi:hypothetical protein
VLAEQNLTLNSQGNFTNAYWNKQNVTVTDNTVIAPDGTTTASTLTTSVGLATHDIVVTGTYAGTTAGTYTESWFIKPNTSNFVTVFLTYVSTQWVCATANLSTGTITQTGSSGASTYVSSSITASTNGYYRITLTYSITSTSGMLPGVQINSSATPTYGSFGIESWTALGTESVYIWGAQLEQRSSVTAYNATTTSALTNYIPQLLTAPINSPRFDFNPTTGESLGLLIEQSSSNLELYSGAVGGTGWTSSNGSINLTAGIAPDGTQTFSKFTEDTTTSIHYIYPNFVTISSGTVYTASFYVKAAGRNFIVFQGDTGLGNLGAYSGFDLATGTLIGLGSGVTSGTITSQGNGVYRISVTAIATGTSARMGVALRTTSGTSAQSYAGDGYSGIYIWGAQLEALAFPTSYISTTSAQVTRASDNASMTGTNFSSWYNPSTISVFLQGSRKVTGVSNQAFFQFGSGDFLALYSLGGNDQVYNQAVGVSGSVNTTLGATTLASKKIAMSYIAGSFQGAYNGTLGTTQTPANLPSNVSVLYLGYTGSGSYLNGWIQKFAFYPIQFTSAQQQSITGS